MAEAQKPHLTCTTKEIIWAGSGEQNQVQVAGINARHFKCQLGRASSMLTQILPLCQYVAFPAAQSVAAPDNHYEGGRVAILKNMLKVSGGL